MRSHDVVFLTNTRVIWPNYSCKNDWRGVTPLVAWGLLVRFRHVVSSFTVFDLVACPFQNMTLFSYYILFTIYTARSTPRAVYHSDGRDKHDRPRWDSNLGPLAPQSGVLPVNVISHRDLLVTIAKPAYHTYLLAWSQNYREVRTACRFGDRGPILSCQAMVNDVDRSRSIVERADNRRLERRQAAGREAPVELQCLPCQPSCLDHRCLRLDGVSGCRRASTWCPSPSSHRSWLRHAKQIQLLSRGKHYCYSRYMSSYMCVMHSSSDRICFKSSPVINLCCATITQSAVKTVKMVNGLSNTLTSTTCRCLDILLPVTTLPGYSLPDTILLLIFFTSVTIFPATLCNRIQVNNNSTSSLNSTIIVIVQ